MHCCPIPSSITRIHTIHTVVREQHHCIGAPPGSEARLHTYKHYIYTYITYIHTLHIYIHYIYTNITYIHTLHIYIHTYIHTLHTSSNDRILGQVRSGQVRSGQVRSGQVNSWILVWWSPGWSARLGCALLPKQWCCSSTSTDPCIYIFSNK